MFRHLAGGEDPNAESIYRWHIDKRSGSRMQAGLTTDNWKRNLDDYVMSAKGLLLAMQRDGFSEDHPIPVDPDGEILNGSHRLACALCLKLKVVPVEYSDKHAWAPDWNYGWFLQHGIEISQLQGIMTDFYEMQR